MGDQQDKPERDDRDEHEKPECCLGQEAPNQSPQRTLCMGPFFGCAFNAHTLSFFVAALISVLGKAIVFAT